MNERHEGMLAAHSAHKVNTPVNKAQGAIATGQARHQAHAPVLECQGTMDTAHRTH